MPEPGTERIGGYTVHPVASLFPLMDEETFDSLKTSIQFKGQQVPIVVQNGLLLDGRNRLKACLELKRDPWIIEYTGTLVPGEYIFQLNFERRDLTDAERLDISFNADALIKQEARERQRKGGKAGGKAAGRGRPKDRVMTNSSEPCLALQLPEFEEGKNSAPAKQQPVSTTRAKLAAKAGVSEHKAQQYLNVKEHAPELLADVKRGKMPLPEAARKATAKRKVPQRAKTRPWNTDRALKRIATCVNRLLRGCPTAEFSVFRQRLLEVISNVSPN